MMNMESANDQSEEHFEKIPVGESDAAEGYRENQAATPTTSRLHLRGHETVGVKSPSSPAVIREDDTITEPVTTTNVINANDAIDDDDDTATTTIRSMLQETFHVSDQPHSVSADTTPVCTTTKSCEENPTSATNDCTPSTAATEYYNHGLATWERNRRQWLQRRRPTNTHKEQNLSNSDSSQQQQEETSMGNEPRQQHDRNHAKPINVDEIIDAIFSSHKKLLLNNGTSDQFPQSVPLPQLVDILQDLWEAESL